jgi:hypothetical protein
MKTKVTNQRKKNIFRILFSGILCNFGAIYLWYCVRFVCVEGGGGGSEELTYKKEKFLLLLISANKIDKRVVFYH